MITTSFVSLGFLFGPFLTVFDDFVDRRWKMPATGGGVQLPVTPPPPPPTSFRRLWYDFIPSKVFSYWMYRLLSVLCQRLTNNRSRI